MCAIYESIKNQIQYWIKYENDKPKVPYNESTKKLYDEYRSKNDRDCVLNDGNLLADTIFSLWLPLRFALVNLHTYYEIKEITGYSIVEKNINFLQTLDNSIECLLPKEDEVTEVLSELFVMGVKRVNTMILPDRGLQYKQYDYMPNFLKECFVGGKYSYAFNYNNEKFKDWVSQQKLWMFFDDGIISEQNIKDLAHTGDINNNVPKDKVGLIKCLNSYIDILEERQKYLYGI